MQANSARRVTLPGGETVPALGQGTWHLGSDPLRRNAEIAALRLGLDLGMTLIDTAEMYGDGATEHLVGEAIRGRRDEVFLVSKVYPHNAGRRAMAAACDNSLKRLRTNRIDLYLLHWRGRVPLAETVQGFEDLRQAGKIRHWGVSNFDVADMLELGRVAGGRACATDQVLYNLVRRGPEFDLLPWLAERRIPLMAYSPLEQGHLPHGGILEKIAQRHHVTPHQVALAWVLHRPGVIAIPKSGNTRHVQLNREALDLVLDPADLAALDTVFHPPRSKRPLDML